MINGLLHCGWLSWLVCISVIWRDYLKKCSVSVFLMDSTPIHVTCKFARRYGKDCESETADLDFRMSSMISEMADVLVTIQE